MEDIMMIRSAFLRRMLSGIINKALRKQAPGVEVQLNAVQASWSEKDQKMKVHLELDGEVTKAQLMELLNKAGLW